MKKLLVAVGLSLALATGAQAAEKIAVINVANLFQEVAKTSGAETVLDNEFKGRASELQKMDSDLKTKIDRLQKGSNLKAADRTKLEKDVMDERQQLATKAQQFEQDHARRTNEERNKILSRIDTAVKKVAADQKIDVVMDVSNVVYKSSGVKDISADVLKQVK